MQPIRTASVCSDVAKFMNGVAGTALPATLIRQQPLVQTLAALTCQSHGEDLPI